MSDPDFKLPCAQTVTPPEAVDRADSWLAEQMDGHTFVHSESGGLKLGGKQGYFSGGPGLAALAIYNFFRHDPEIINMTEQHPHHPWSAADFERCVELFERVPEWRSRISELADLSTIWEKLIDHWDSLEGAFKKGQVDEVNRLLKDCRAERDKS